MSTSFGNFFSIVHCKGEVLSVFSLLWISKCNWIPKSNICNFWCPGCKSQLILLRINCCITITLGLTSNLSGFQSRVAASRALPFSLSKHHHKILYTEDPSSLMATVCVLVEAPLIYWARHVIDIVCDGPGRGDACSDSTCNKLN